MDTVSEFMNIVWNFILTISLWDVLDVVIIAFLLYRLLMFLRRTSSANVVKGVIVIILVMWLSQLLHLSVVSYLLGETLQMGIVALIVLFQPELRRLLEKLGSSSLKGIFGRINGVSPEDTMIAQVVLACDEMSRTRTGVLIVFERGNKLDEYIKTGTIIDAVPTAELIKNIFYPNTPLHDGALIIRGSRVAGAACMLPLSNNMNLSHELGMRHRAGIGISESSDAVVAIVSEETGAISVAIDGMLKRHLTADTLEKILTNELSPKEQYKPRWKKLRNAERGR